jgi:cell division transport system permease protein
MNHIFASWKNHTRLQVATTVVLIASFCVISGVMVLTHNLSNILTLWGESLQMSVYLSEEANTENISAVEKYLKENTNVDKLKYVKKEEALSQFRDQMASYAPDLLNDDDLLRFIPASFQFSLSKKVAVEDQLNAMKDLAVALKVQQGVEEVSYGQDWIKSYSSLTSGIKWVGFIFMIIVFISAGFVMSNSIHTSINQRRSEIEVLELVGATTKYIREPYILEGAFLGGLSCLLAITLSYGLFHSIKNELKEQIAFLQLTSHIHFFNFISVVGLLTFAIALGALSSWLCVRRINTGWAASYKSKEAH